MASKSAKQKAWSSGMKIACHVIFNIFLYGIFLIGILSFTRQAYRFSYQIFGDITVAEEPGTDVLITIHEGDTTREIAELLEYKGLIVNKNSFFVRAKLMVNDSEPILPGVYQLNTAMNYGEIIEVITNENENLDASD